MAAVALSVIGITRLLFFNSGGATGGALVGWSVWAIAQIGLFVLALRSLGRVGEKWVRTLHLWINGTAVVTVIISWLSVFSFNIFLQVAGIVVLPIETLVPWQLINDSRLFLLIRSAIYLFDLVFAAYFFFRWLRSAPVMAADSQGTLPHTAEQPSDDWRKHRIWAGILTVVLGFFLATIWLAFAQQMSFLTSELSGLGPRGISVPFFVIAVVLAVVIGGVMFSMRQNRGRPMVWFAAVTTPLLFLAIGTANEIFVLIVLAISAYVIWVLRSTAPVKK